METIKRITPEEVIEAFEVTGLTPKQGSYFSSDVGGIKCACGLGVIYYKEAKEFAPSGRIGDYCDAKFGMYYSVGFARGFDDLNLEKYNKTTEDAEKIKNVTIGYEDGVAARLALIEKGMM